MFDLDDRVAVVTGAASGLGRATALAFANAGARVALVDVNEEGAQAVAEEAQAGARTLVVPTDLTQVASIEAMYNQVQGAFGSVDCVANVAGIYPGSPVLDVTEEHWSEVLNLNLRGVFFSCREAMRIMSNQGGGAIVNVASGAAFYPIMGLVAYSASKGGLVAMTRVLALEGRSMGIRVNTLAPGPIARPGMERLDPSAAERGVRLADRSVQPEELANSVLYLCSPLASGITGAIVNANAGNYMPTG